MEPHNPQNQQPQTNPEPNQYQPPVAPFQQPQPQQQQQQQQQQHVPPQPQVVQVMRPLDPVMPHVSPEAQQKHADSKAKYPFLNLSQGEYVINVVKRHPIGLLQIWAATAIVIIVLVTFIVLLLANPGGSVAGLNESTGSALPLLSLPLLLLSVLVLAGGAIGTFVYQANTFFMTNESVIQNIQISLFAKRSQTVSLGNIEDASYVQAGILQSMLNYGSIRLSTEGDETTYRFSYASNPEAQVAKLNNAVEDFKNGRPVQDY